MATKFSQTLTEVQRLHIKTLAELKVVVYGPSHFSDLVALNLVSKTPAANRPGMFEYRLNERGWKSYHHAKSKRLHPRGRSAQW